MPEVSLAELFGGPRRPEIGGDIRPASPVGVDPRTAAISGNALPQGPGDPGYASRIPPAEPWDPGDPEFPAALNEAVAAVAPQERRVVAQPEYRVVLTNARDEGMVIVTLEQAPEYDEGDSRKVPWDSVVDLYPVLKQLAKIKNLTGEPLEVEPTPISRPASRRQKTAVAVDS